MKERAQELKAEARANKSKADGEAGVLAKIEEMVEPDKSIAKRLHELVKTNVPGLAPKTWYGMPAYSKEGKAVFFFQSGQKYGTRYCTLGFNDAAMLDEGNMWPTSFALVKLTPEIEERIVELVKRAAG
jgi:uncharacterized protein YdhG (YjbR/CyaY superfamily)